MGEEEEEEESGDSSDGVKGYRVEERWSAHDETESAYSNEEEEIEDVVDGENAMNSGKSLNGIDISSTLCTENVDMMEMEFLPQLMLKSKAMTVSMSMTQGMDHESDLNLNHRRFDAMDVLSAIGDR